MSRGGTISVDVERQRDGGGDALRVRIGIGP